MFTTIAALRASHAIQSRVTTVENYLKKHAKAYTPDMIFPIAIIAQSNHRDDFEWVEDNKATHSKKGYVNGVHLDLTAVTKGIDYEKLTAAKRVEAVESAVNAKLGGKGWTWKDGIWPTAATALTPASQSGIADAATQAVKEAKPKKEKKASVTKTTAKKTKPSKAESKPLTEAVAKTFAAKSAPAAWLTTNVPDISTTKVSKHETTKQRKNVREALRTLIDSGLVDGGIVRGTGKTEVFVITL